MTYIKRLKIKGAVIHYIHSVPLIFSQKVYKNIIRKYGYKKILEGEF